MSRLLSTLALSLSLATAQAAPETPMPADHDHHHHHAEGDHGNPADMEEYLKRLEDPSRDEWQKPDAVVKALGLKSGQVACDVGAGPGYFSLRMARAVGDTGHVFGVDVEPRMVDVLRARIATAKADNVTPVLTAFDRTLLPARTCDVVLVVNAYHHFDNGKAYLAQLKRVLKPGGVVVNIDFHNRDTPVGPPVERRIAREAFLQDAQAAGYTLKREETFLPYQYLLVLAPR